MSKDTVADEVVFKQRDEKTGRVIEMGRLIGKTFRKSVVYTAHYYRIGDAYAIAEWIIDILQEHECETIIIMVTDRNEVYSIDFERFIELSTAMQHKNYERQLYVPLSEWTRINGKPSSS